MEHKRRDVTKLKKNKGILQNGIQQDVTKWNTTRCYKMEYKQRAVKTRTPPDRPP